MSIAAACHFPQRFTSIVAVAGWVPLHCPRMNMSLVTVGGTEDPDLGAVKAASNADEWRSGVMVGCRPSPAIARYVTSTITTWTCSNGRYVKLVQLINVPHVWPTYDFYGADAEVLRVAAGNPTH
jgi:poly(3-hydroxybutyrate) depolymerase